jgi:hypothetical protein
MKMLSVFVSVILALLGSAPLPASHPDADDPGHGSPSAPGLLLPYFAVDAFDQTGRTTLFSLVNVSGTAVMASVRLFSASGIEVATPRSKVIGAYEVAAFNVRDMLHWSAGTGLVEGFAVVKVEGLVPCVDQDLGGSCLAQRPITGDFFLVDPSNDYASGDRLVAVEIAADGSLQGLRSSGVSRFLLGGAISGGTRFLVFRTDPSAPLSARVCSEAGECHPWPAAGMGMSYPFHRMTQAVDAAEIVGTDTPFGAVYFDLGGPGWVGAIMSAEGRFAVQVGDL